jgi:uncharacterized membrane protein (UPF0136 family)
MAAAGNDGGSAGPSYYCSYCGARLEPTSRFCSSCGRATPLAADQEAAAPAAATPKSRPTGVTIVAILNILGGIFMFVFVPLAVIGTSVSPALAEEVDDVGFVLTVLGILIAIGIVYFVVAYGLLKGRSWAWTVAVILSIISIVLNVISIGSYSILTLVSIILDGLILYYLYRPHVKEYFGKIRK